MPAFRVYFIDRHSVIATDTVDARTGTEAAATAAGRLTSYPPAQRVEVWRDDVAWQGADHVHRHRPS
jgi:hypothetical protein